MSSFSGDVARKESQLPGAFPSEDVITENTEGSLAHEPITTGAGHSNATGASTNTTSADPNAPNITEDVRRLAAGAMTTATAVGLAARDAAVTAKDAIMPAASVASEKAVSAASYTKDSAVDVASAARANAPSIIPGTDNRNNNTTTHNTNTGLSSDETSTGVPIEVRDSILKSGQAPEAAADRQAVQDKSRMEDELLASVSTTQAGSGDGSRGLESQVNRGTPGLGASSGHGSAASRPMLYTQDTGSYQEPGTAVVLGTDTERAFPLGAKSEPQSSYTSTATATSVPDFAETPNVTTGLENRETAGTSTGTGRRFNYAHDSDATSHAEDVGSGLGSTDERVPRSTHEAPIQDKVPVRESEEPTVGNGPGAYKTLGSGTPSGVRG